jgi:hypothetical protein
MVLPAFGGSGAVVVAAALGLRNQAKHGRALASLAFAFGILTVSCFWLMQRVPDVSRLVEKPSGDEIRVTETGIPIDPLVVVRDCASRETRSTRVCCPLRSLSSWIAART